jgi:hypothetical protein
MNDYLWDKTGSPDTDVQRLEGLLAAYRQQRAFVFPESFGDEQQTSAIMVEQSGWSWPWRVAAFAAVILIIFAMTIALLKAGRGQVEWQARRSSGEPAVDAKTLSGEISLDVGTVITTDAKSEVELKAAGHGRIRVLPRSEVRLVASGSQHQRLALDHGTIEASLYAPPFMFSFATPSGTAYDIGCAFRLSVGEDKRGMLEVLSGWVQFEVGEAQELAPAGTEVAIEPGFAPGTAIYEDASPEFKAAVRKLDFGEANEREAALDEALAQARPKDVYTLLRLMRTATPEERGRIFDRASVLKPPPSWVTREGIMRREDAMMNAWSNSLGLGDAKRWWVNWKDRF